MAPDLLPASIRDFVSNILSGDPRPPADFVLIAAEMLEDLARECATEDRPFAAYQARSYAALLQGRVPSRSIGAKRPPFPALTLT